MSKCELRACCKRPEAALYSFADAPRDKYLDGSPSAVIAVMEAPPPPSEDTAFHEAAHAAAMHAFGAPLRHVTIAGQPHASGDQTNLELAARLVMYMAGPAASDAYFRRTTTLYDDELIAYVERVDDLVMGNCDQCQAMLIASVAAGKTLLDRVAIFREGERRANEFVREKRVWQAIRALAADLMVRPTCSGKRAHSILEPFIKFGEFKQC